MPDDVLIYGDTIRNASILHEVPLAIPDPFLYVEANASRHVVVGSLELPRVRELAGVVAHPYEEFGYDALAEQGLSREEAVAEVTVRAVQALSVTAATVPDDFPVGLADRLRALGV